MAHRDDAAFYRTREQQELLASDNATDAPIKRLHWEMAQRHAYLAEEADRSAEDEGGTVSQ